MSMEILWDRIINVMCPFWRVPTIFYGSGVNAMTFISVKRFRFKFYEFLIVEHPSIVLEIKLGRNLELNITVLSASILL